MLLSNSPIFLYLLLFISAINVTKVSSTVAAEDNIIIPTPNYRTPKNIVFSTQGGGSSHHMWVLEILKEMHHRGHNVSFFSRGDQLRFANDYPMVKTRQVGGPEDFVRHPLLAKHLASHPPQEIVALGAVEACMINYPSEYTELKALFESERIDLAVCDSFAVSCIDTAIVSNLPVIITSTFGLYADFGAPYINNRIFTQTDSTTQKESLWFRVYREYIRVPTIMWRLSKTLKHAHAFQRKLGLTPTVDSSATRYNHIPKLVNNVYGIEVARKLSPLFHMVGPIMRGNYPALDSATRDFLDSHKRIVLVAFGQHAMASDQDVHMLMQTLLRLMKEGHIDGVIWARLNHDQIPTKSIKTPNQRYSHQDIINHPNIYLIPWAPQYAILQHPSTSFFISHGGVGSMHESLYSGVRLFVYPFFGDQPGNARAVERAGIGKYMNTINMKYDTACYNSLYEKLYAVAADPQHKIQDTVDRYRAYIQVMANNAITRGADLLEESLFASDNQGKLYYRYDVGYDMHWIKRNNVDVYAVLVLFALITAKLGFMLLWNILMPKYNTFQKIKTA